MDHREPLKIKSSAAIVPQNKSIDHLQQTKLTSAHLDPIQQEAMLIAIINSSDDAIISKDLNGEVTSWNKSAERIFGHSAQEMVGQSITILIPPDRLVEEPRILLRIAQGERVDHFQT